MHVSPLHVGPCSSDGPHLGHFRSKLNHYKQKKEIADYSFEEELEYRDGRDHFRSTVTVTLASGEIVIGCSESFFPSKQSAKEAAAKDAVEKIDEKGVFAYIHRYIRVCIFILICECSTA